MFNLVSKKFGTLVCGSRLVTKSHLRLKSKRKYYVLYDHFPWNVDEKVICATTAFFRKKIVPKMQKNSTKTSLWNSVRYRIFCTFHYIWWRELLWWCIIFIFVIIIFSLFFKQITNTFASLLLHKHKQRKCNEHANGKMKCFACQKSTSIKEDLSTTTIKMRFFFCISSFYVVICVTHLQHYSVFFRIYVWKSRFCHSRKNPLGCAKLTCKNLILFVPGLFTISENGCDARMEIVWLFLCLCEFNAFDKHKIQWI